MISGRSNIYLLFSLAILSTAILSAGLVFHFLKPLIVQQTAITTFKNLIEEHIHKANMPQCQNDFTRFGEEMTAGSEFSFVSKWKHSSKWKALGPELSIINSISAMHFKNTALDGTDIGTTAVGFLLSAGTVENCSTNFIRVMPVESQCSDFDAAPPVDAVKHQSINGLSHYTLANSWSLLLIPAKNNCTVITFHQQSQ